MATITFAGSTVWNDQASGTARGVGTVVYSPAVPSRVREYANLIRGNGSVAKNLGYVGGALGVSFLWSLTGASISSTFAMLESLYGKYGTVTLSNGQSFSDCVLDAHDSSLVHYEEEAGGAVTYSRFAVRLSFRRLKV